MAELIKLFEDTDQTSLYAKYRPTYAGCGLIPAILQYLQSGEEQRKLSLAVDVGCGQGQVIGGLATNFDKVLGVDVSKEQIAQAQALNTLSNVEYQVSEAENLPVKDNSADLVTVCTALHWFDIPKFYKEVDRVLRPGGVIAVSTATVLPDIINHPKADELTDIISQFSTKLSEGGYWHKRVKLVADRYKAPEIQIPYETRTRNENMRVVEDVTVGHLISLLRTFSAVNKYLKEKASQNESPTLWTTFLERFCDVYGNGKAESKLSYKVDLVLLLGRKPT